MAQPSSSISPNRGATDAVTVARRQVGREAEDSPCVAASALTGKVQVG